ncbi:hypothetical protein T484DRAFT_1941998 [Baffinella frigidus]|nr:hypothetical protein T484DRAFT_1941998 [Cryptophyta sp. CCMP2293]
MFFPAVSHAEMVEVMRGAAAVVNSSKSEGMCGSLLEAMAVGTPTLSRAVSGNLELILHRQTGLLYSSPAECVALGKELLGADGALRLSLTKHACRYVEEHHSAALEKRVFSRALALLHPPAKRGGVKVDDLILAA